MIKEIKPIILGSAYDFIDLDKYTNNKDSIKIIFEDTKEDFTDWTLTDSGLIRIECGVLDYKKYKDAYSINMIIEYEPSLLPLDLYEIDTIDGLTKNITDMKSFKYISDIRSAAHRKFGIKLNQFILFNSVLFDQFGQVMKLEYENQYHYDLIADFISVKDFAKFVQSYSYTSGSIPNHNSICPHCNQKWTLKTLRDCVRYGDDLYHKECNKFNLYEKAKKEFDFIASGVFSKYSLAAIKNQYGSETYRGPWFIINTEDGDITIGWRKRVIEINWLPNYKEFKFSGENEDTTKEFSNKERYIHAWSIEKAIEYLLDAKISIKK